MAGEKNQSLNSFAHHLQTENFRRSFSSDPAGALKAAGIDSSQIPKHVLDAFSGLSYDELTTLAHVQKKVEPRAADGTGCNFF